MCSFGECKISSESENSFESRISYYFHMADRETELLAGISNVKYLTLEVPILEVTMP